MAAVAGADNKPSGAKGFIVALALVVLIGGGAGAGFAMLVLNQPDGSGVAPAAGVAQSTPTRDAGAGKDHASKSSQRVQAEVVHALEPIHVSLAGAKENWLRLDASVIFSGADDGDRSVMAKQIAQDILGFLRTVRLSQIDNAVGLEFLREDLTEIARVRSKGKTRGLLLRALMIE